MVVMVCCFSVKSQHAFTATILDSETTEPLPGVTVYLPELEIGTTSDFNGNVSFPNIPKGTYTFQFSYVGYQKILRVYSFPLPDSMQSITIELYPDHEELEEVIIASTRSSRTIEDIPTRVEFIAGEELVEKGNMKPGDIRMLLNESTGIQTQQTSATSYNSSIRIQGLDGKYTQLLRDGLPLYSGYSGGLSLMQIAPLDLKQVEVIKGSSSTLYGGGAIAGIVNLISKTPTEDQELNIMLNGTSALGLDASAFYSEKFGKVGTTVFASYNYGSAYDPADIGLTAIPKFNRLTLNPKIYFYLNPDTEIQAGLNYVHEDRLGGNIDYVKGEEVPNAYFERNETDRISTQFKFSHRLNAASRLEFKNSLSSYDREISIPDYSFGGRQFSSFSEFNYSAYKEALEWIVGVNHWADKFEQSSGSPGQDLGYDLNTFGVFGQNIWNISSIWTLETGLRGDYNSEYGFFLLPRFSIMMEPNSALTFRLGGGLGYKTPTVFSEEAERIQFQNILPTDTGDLDSERSMGGNFDINYRISLNEKLSLSTNALFFYTRIDDPLQLVQVGSYYQFQQPAGYIDTKGVEVNLKLTWRDFKLFTGYTFSDVEQHYGAETTQFPLVARHRLNNVLMFEKHENFWIGLEGYYFSPQELNDGTTGKSYWIMGLMTEKRIGRRFSIFLNFENFLDTRQTRFDTIYTGSIDDPQFRDIYAPVDGFVINGGFKIKLMSTE